MSVTLFYLVSLSLSLFIFFPLLSEIWTLTAKLSLKLTSVNKLAILWQIRWTSIDGRARVAVLLMNFAQRFLPTVNFFITVLAATFFFIFELVRFGIFYSSEVIGMWNILMQLMIYRKMSILERLCEFVVENLPYWL